MVDLWGQIGVYSLLVAIFLSPFCFILGCTIYTPVSIAMVGLKGFTRIKLEDFGNVVITGETKDVLVILAELGHIGQFIWTALFVLLGFYCWGKCTSKEEENG